MLSPSAVVDVEETDEPLLDERPDRPHLDRSSEWLFLAFLAGCALYLLYWASHRLLDFDELLSYYTDKIASAEALLRVQASIPVSLDPPLYHLLGHWALHLPLNPTLAVRLPSLLGCMMMVASVYLFTRRLAGSVIAAMAVTGLLVADNFHLAEARPYGILLGATGAALLLWQNAVRGTNRTASLIGLFLALGLATSCHYFGILVALLFLLVESARVLRCRTIDLPLAAALLGSFVFAAAWLPFLKAAHRYKSNYYIKVHFTDLLKTYTSPFDAALKISSPYVDAALALAIVALAAVGAYLGSRSAGATETRTVETVRMEWQLVFAMALLPVLGVVLASAASGAFETRFVVEFSIGLSIAIGSLVAHVVRSRLVRNLMLLGCCVVILQRFAAAAGENKRDAAALTRISLQIAPQKLTVIADDEEFARLHYYRQKLHPSLRSAVWIADMNREIDFTGSDDIDRTMLNLTHFSDLPVISYADLVKGRSTFGLVVCAESVPQNWIEHQLRHDGFALSPMAVDGSNTFYEVKKPSRQP